MKYYKVVLMLIIFGVTAILLVLAISSVDGVEPEIQSVEVPMKQGDLICFNGVDGEVCLRRK